MNAPKLRFKNAEGADFPLWTMSKLGNEVHFRKGGKLGKSDLQKDGSHQCLLYGELYTSYGSIASKIFSRTDTNSGMTSQKNDVVMPTSGETAEDIATATCIPFDGILYGGDLIILRSDTLYGPFLSYQINSSLKRKISRVAQGKSVVHIGAEKIKPISFSFPCLEEQQKIASFFSTLDQKIELNERKLEALEKLKKGLMKKIFNQEIQFKTNKGKDFPDWTFSFLKNCLSMLKDGTHGSFKNSEKGYPLLSAKDVDNVIAISDDCRLISKEDYCSIYAKYSLKPNDVLLTIVGTIGRTAIVPTPAPEVAFQRSVAILRVNENLQPLYLRYFLQTNFVENYLNKVKKSGAQSGIYLSDLGKLPIFVPDPEEQKRIAAFFHLLDSKIDLIKGKLRTNKHLKQAFLQQMFV